MADFRQVLRTAEAGYWNRVNEETFEAVRKVLASKVRVHHGNEWASSGSNDAELDPDYNGLRAVFTRRDCSVKDCDTCQVISRYNYWRGADDGSFEGALMKVLNVLWLTTQSLGTITLIRLIGALLRSELDTRQAACEVVLKWLREEP